MSVLIFIDNTEGQIKKSSYEAAFYGSQIAKRLNLPAYALFLGTTTEDLSQLGNYGISKVFTINNPALNQLDAQLFTKLIAEAAVSTQAGVVIFSNNIAGKAIAPRLSIRLKAGLVMGAVDYPQTESGFVVKKSVFSGKAFAQVSIDTTTKIIALNPNSINITSSESIAAIAELPIAVDTPRTSVVSTNKIVGEVPLTEAEIVISGGRGLKGPENWHLVTDLAKLLGAATACSRPVADIHWRPHHEHVGQTGIAIAPNLYFAIGISGAIQHLAGVNRSKTIVVINKDPEAPFFKAADYGIVGDAFEVMPRIIDAVKKLKGV